MRLCPTRWCWRERCTAKSCEIAANLWKLWNFNKNLAKNAINSDRKQLKLWENVMPKKLTGSAIANPVNLIIIAANSTPIDWKLSVISDKIVLKKKQDFPRCPRLGVPLYANFPLCLISKVRNVRLSYKVLIGGLFLATEWRKRMHWVAQTNATEWRKRMHLFFLSVCLTFLCGCFLPFQFPMDFSYFKC